ncbi:hypothetical protein CY34DRAFT_804131 [Suillus luteus UH-Slu-Lm8-n1]|uniref:Uncharacterized protein n=1 Tax=Suillus luteus UH-Slu-Lm8-n1 TaxID=930992 RepID=A0A0D0AZE5_9AGAM|nr:hypothetical protein CY34DRAFT_804131 [Suillus luteus UH-Slu-Lm8-n1]
MVPQVPATLPLSSSLLAQTATRFDQVSLQFYTNSGCTTLCLSSLKQVLHLHPRMESSNPYDSIFPSESPDTTMGHQSLKSHQAANSLDLLLPNYRNTRK